MPQSARISSGVQPLVGDSSPNRVVWLVSSEWGAKSRQGGLSLDSYSDELHHLFHNTVAHGTVGYQTTTMWNAIALVVLLLVLVPNAHGCLDMDGKPMRGPAALCSSHVKLDVVDQDKAANDDMVREEWHPSVQVQLAMSRLIREITSRHQIRDMAVLCADFLRTMDGVGQLNQPLHDLVHPIMSSCEDWTKLDSLNEIVVQELQRQRDSIEMLNREVPRIWAFDKEFREHIEAMEDAMEDDSILFPEAWFMKWTDNGWRIPRAHVWKCTTENRGVRGDGTAWFTWIPTTRLDTTTTPRRTWIPELIVTSTHMVYRELAGVEVICPNDRLYSTWISPPEIVVEDDEDSPWITWSLQLWGRRARHLPGDRESKEDILRPLMLQPVFDDARVYTCELLAW